MPKFKQIVPYKIRRALPILGLAGASLMPMSCSKNGEDEPPIPQHDLVLEFFETENLCDYRKVESVEQLKTYAADKSIANIYLTVMDGNDYTFSDEKYLKSVYNFLKARIEISPKMHGRGNFLMPVGMLPKADSLWMVQNGWTVNKHLQNQK